MPSEDRRWLEVPMGQKFRRKREKFSHEAPLGGRCLPGVLEVESLLFFPFLSSFRNHFGYVPFPFFLLRPFLTARVFLLLPSILFSLELFAISFQRSAPRNPTTWFLQLSFIHVHTFTLSLFFFSEVSFVPSRATFPFCVVALLFTTWQNSSW